MDEFVPIWALGLMTGTSMDGVDAASLLTDGERIFAFGPASAAPIHHQDYRAVREVVARGRAFWDAPEPDLLGRANGEVLGAHLPAVACALSAQEVDLIGFHGQTVFHAPDEGWTKQLGDGDALARVFRRPTVWDFRSADMAAGGQGAPLAPFYHLALAKWIGAEAPLAFLNLGGVGNVTWVDPMADGPEQAGALLAFDTGPANALIDDWMLRRTGSAFDEDGRAAARGQPDHAALRANSVEEYFERPAPKSLDRNAFSLIAERLTHLSTEDGAATLTALTVESVFRAVEHLPGPPAQWIVCGGGRRNQTLMAMLSARLSAPVRRAEDVGLDGDALEAQAFAYLAVRAIRGLPLSAPATTGCGAPSCGGVISRPEPQMG